MEWSNDFVGQTVRKLQPFVWEDRFPGCVMFWLTLLSFCRISPKMQRCDISGYGGLRSIQCKISHISGLKQTDSNGDFLFYLRTGASIGSNEMRSNWFWCLLFNFLNLHFFICFLMLQLMKIESERLSRWITEYLNWNLVNCLEESYAHKYTTNTHVIHCGLATSTRQSMSSPSLLATAKQCLEINGSLV